MAKRACLSVDEVVRVLDDTTEECDSEDADCDFDADEPIMEGSDEEFGEFDEELRDQIEVDEMEDENVAQECVVHINSSRDCETSEGTQGEEYTAGVDENRHRILPTEWSEELVPVHIPPFTSTIGPTVQLPESALDLFAMYFTEA